MGEVVIGVRTMVGCLSVQELRVTRKVFAHHRILIVANKVVEWLF